MRTFAGLLPERMALVLCLILLTLAAFLAQGADSRLFSALYLGADAQGVEFWRWIGFWGSTTFLFPAVVLSSLILFGRRRGNAALSAALGLLLGWGLTTLTVDWLKWIVGRERPAVLWLAEPVGSAFPSGHAAQAAYVCFFLWGLLYSCPTAQRSRVSAGLRRMGLGVLGTLPWLVGCSRVLLGVHWPSDVLVGWAVGLFFSAMALLAGQDVVRLFGKQAG